MIMVTYYFLNNKTKEDIISQIESISIGRDSIKFNDISNIKGTEMNGELVITTTNGNITIQTDNQLDSSAVYILVRRFMNNKVQTTGSRRGFK